MKVSKTPLSCHFPPTCMGPRPAPLHRCQCPPPRSLGVQSSYNVAPSSTCCERLTTEFPAPSHLQGPSCPHLHTFNHPNSLWPTGPLPDPTFQPVTCQDLVPQMSCDQGGPRSQPSPTRAHSSTPHPGDGLQHSGSQWEDRGSRV